MCLKLTVLSIRFLGCFFLYVHPPWKEKNSQIWLCFLRSRRESPRWWADDVWNGCHWLDYALCRWMDFSLWRVKCVFFCSLSLWNPHVNMSRQDGNELICKEIVVRPNLTSFFFFILICNSTSLAHTIMHYFVMTASILAWGSLISSLVLIIFF